MVAGSFYGAGLPNDSLLRLRDDGVMDPSFPATSAPLSVVGATSVEVAPDGRLLVAASVVNEGKLVASGLVRLLADGRVDVSFGVSGCVDAQTLNAFRIRPDGRVLLGGRFQVVAGVPRTSLAQVNAEGSLDPGFNAASGIDSYLYEATALSNGQVFLGGGFTTVQGEPCSGLARLNADGSLDRSFQPAPNPLLPLPGASASSDLAAAVPVRDGKVVLGGIFRTNASLPGYVSLARVDRNGTLDPTFHTPTVHNASMPGNAFTVDRLLPAPDGKMVILSAYMDLIDDHPAHQVGRVLEDGNPDTAFRLAAEFIDATVGDFAYHLDQLQAALPLADGKLMVAGRVVPAPSQPFRSLMARLNEDGSLDPRFAMVGFGRPYSPGFSPVTIPLLLAQRDGRIIVQSGFPLVNEVPRPFGILARINPDGTLDEAFDPDLDQPVAAMLQQADGKLLLAGRFRTVNGVSRRGLARLNLDGSIDPSFDPGTGPGTGVNLSGDSFDVFCLALQPDGKLLAGGDFPGFDGFPVDNLVRLFGGDRVIPVAPRFLSPIAAAQPGQSFQLRIGTGRGQTVVVEASPNLAPGSWVPLTTNQATSDVIEFSDPAAGLSERSYRAFAR